jgi:hypothetical protein
MTNVEIKRMARELKRMAPLGINYTQEEAEELVEYGAPWNLDWYINGEPVVQASGLMRWKERS